MNKVIFFSLTALASAPGAALAHPGHIADLGHGHSHWMAYWLAATVAFGLAAWAIAKLRVGTSARARGGR